jgi:hypothetical protein
MLTLHPQQRVSQPCLVLQAAVCAGSVLCLASGLEMRHIMRQKKQIQQQQL